MKPSAFIAVPRPPSTVATLATLAGRELRDALRSRWFLLYTLATSTWGWDTGRAITNVVAIILVGRAVLVTLRRATRKAAFDAPVAFEP